ncbi:MAG TPA: RDD family protein [Thermoanaerobaculia bacterium]|nr:RDD family protein [Thermoanaerobaculia bacterium]
MSRKSPGADPPAASAGSSRRRRSADLEPLLFDLPLVPPERGPARGAAPSAEPTQPQLFANAEPDPGDRDEIAGSAPSDLEAVPETDAPAGPVIAPLPSRLLAGCADTLVHLGVLAGVYLGLVALGVEPRIGHWPALATLLVTFSFLSSVVSLAFWGQTAGMAWRGLQSRDRLQRPLTFRQATLRWAGGLVTFAAAGLPLLLALGGASLADWLSRSVTYQVPGSATGR